MTRPLVLTGATPPVFYEGIITIGIGLLLFFLYPSDPSTSRILNEDERALALSRLSAGQLDGSSTSRAKSPTVREVVRIIAHPQVLAAILFYIFNNVTVQGLNSFLPSALRRSQSIPKLTRSLGAEQSSASTTLAPPTFVSSCTQCRQTSLRSGSPVRSFRLLSETSG